MLTRCAPSVALTAAAATTLSAPPASDTAASLSEVAFASEAEAILAALDRNAGNRARTAQSLGISERTLRYRLATMRANGLLAAGGRA